MSCEKVGKIDFFVLFFSTKTIRLIPSPVRLLSLRGTSLPHTAFITLWWFWLHVSTFHHQDTRRVTQPNLIAKIVLLGNRFLISNASLVQKTRKQKLTGQMTENTVGNHFASQYSPSFKNEEIKVNHQMTSRKRTRSLFIKENFNSYEWWTSHPTSPPLKRKRLDIDWRQTSEF